MRFINIKKIFFLLSFLTLFSTASYSNEEIHWKIDNKYLTPKCFVYEWMSSDNFKEFYSNYYPNLKINLIPKEERYSYFFRYIGTFYIVSIPLEDVFKSSWGKKLSLTTYLQDCLSDKPQNENIKKGDGEKYEVVKNDKLKDKKLMCKRYAPQIQLECIDIKTIEITEFFSGSMPPYSSLNTYGIFRLENQKKIILPLAFNDSVINEKTKAEEKVLKKDFYNWLSSQNKYDNSNALYWDEDFQIYLKTAVNKIQLYLGINGKLPKSDLLDIFKKTLVGPPDDLKYSDNKRFLSISACKASECGNKGLLWVDTKDKKNIGVILHYFYQNNEFISKGNLLIFSKNFEEVTDLPNEFFDSLNQWKIKNKISPDLVRFLNSKNEIRILPATK